MAAELERHLDPLAGGSRDRPLPELLIEAVIEALAEHEHRDGTAALGADHLFEILELFEHDAVRTRIQALERLAWRLRLDPACSPVRLRARQPRARRSERPIRGNGGSVIGPRESRAAILGAGRIGGEVVRAMLPSFDAPAPRIGDRSWRDLPVGAVLVEPTSTMSYGAIGIARISAERIPAAHSKEPSPSGSPEPATVGA